MQSTVGLTVESADSLDLGRTHHPFMWLLLFITGSNYVQTTRLYTSISEVRITSQWLMSVSSILHHHRHWFPRHKTDRNITHGSETRKANGISICNCSVQKLQHMHVRNARQTIKSTVLLTK